MHVYNMFLAAQVITRQTDTLQAILIKIVNHTQPIQNMIWALAETHAHRQYQSLLYVNAVKSCESGQPSIYESFFPLALYCICSPAAIVRLKPSFILI